MNYISTIVKVENGSYIAAVHEYEWAKAKGNSFEEAKKNIEKILIGRISNEKKIIKPFTIETIKMLNVISEYEKRMNDLIFVEIKVDESKLIKNFNSSVRTNVSIKNGLKELAKRNNINISKLLNEALEKELLSDFDKNQKK